MFRTISVQQLEYLLDGERTFTLLDVREQREYEAGHLLGAVNLPYERLRFRKTALWSSTAPTGARACLRRGSLQGAGMTR